MTSMENTKITHNNIVHNLSNDVAFQLDKRIVCFIYNALNHSNKVCRLLLLAKLHSISFFCH